ncbi:MAG: hypothetical protein CMJ28_02045 [Phycisphaerae bacterium]|nr:hypothetical protein [Phycisphaerae bacterium]
MTTPKILGVLFLMGCSHSLTVQEDIQNTPDPRFCPVFDGHSGKPMMWSELQDRFSKADAVMLGEMHDDLVGHLVQQALLEDAPSGTGLALEMLERDEQPLLDDFRDGVIDQETFRELTGSTNWAGLKTWDTFYQPSIDIIFDREGLVFAANAPRRYVRHARIAGKDALPTDGTRSAWFSLPTDIDDQEYRNRFFDLMGENTDPATGDRFYLAQRIWDASMGKSLADLRSSGAQPAVLLVGAFHILENGATVLEYSHRRPSDEILTVSLVPDFFEMLPDDLMHTADVVISTGSRGPSDQ